VEELCDLRCAVSEAVTNCIVHAYRGYPSAGCYIYISVRLYETREVSVEVSDNGCGIEDIERARAPMFTTGDPSERCGMGFLVMDSFTDSLTVKSRVGKGTSVLMRKILSPVSTEGK
jgi:stage II sporulation protein AB (anti-sigma F factor)